jgi:hypothetical protein
MPICGQISAEKLLQLDRGPEFPIDPPTTSKGKEPEIEIQGRPTEAASCADRMRNARPGRITKLVATKLPDSWYLASFRIRWPLLLARFKNMTIK